MYNLVSSEGLAILWTFYMRPTYKTGMYPRCFWLLWTRGLPSEQQPASHPGPPLAKLCQASAWKTCRWSRGLLGSPGQRLDWSSARWCCLGLVARTCQSLRWHQFFSRVLLKIPKPMRTFSHSHLIMIGLTLTLLSMLQVSANYSTSQNIYQVTQRDVGHIDDRSFPWLSKGQEAQVDGCDDAGNSNLPQLRLLKVPDPQLNNLSQSYRKWPGSRDSQEFQTCILRVQMPSEV